MKLIRAGIRRNPETRLGQFIAPEGVGLTVELPWPPAELNPNRRSWSQEDLDALRAAYAASSAASDIDLAKLAVQFGRDKANVCRKARALGLTNQKRPKIPTDKKKVRKPKFSTQEERSTSMSENQKRKLAENGHPKGMLGRSHSLEAKEKISAASAAFNASRTEDQVAAMVLKGAQTKIRNGTYAPARQKTTWKAAWRDIGGTRKFYRSKWEANYAYYLQWLKEKNQIQDWKHEPKVFWFEGVKRGTVSYLPDFWVLENTGAEAYHEVKGWMDDRSKTKIKRMQKYHPGTKLVVIDSKGYAALKKSVQGLVPGWEA